MEAGVIPVEHDKLLRDFALATHGAFQPEAVVQKQNPEGKSDLEADHELQFVHGGKVYRFSARNLGDWYDVRAVIAAIHQVLQDIGRPERFFSIHTGDQTACFVFANEKAMRSIAAEYFLPMAAEY